MDNNENKSVFEKLTSDLNKNTTEGSNTAPPAVPVSSPAAVIGPKIKIRGELFGEEDLLIQGNVQGIIDLQDKNLTVGQEGKLRANVSARVITIEGDVEGDIYGKEKIIIRESSNVRGNLVAERVHLEDGAKFRGSIDMDADAERPELVMPKLSGSIRDEADSESKPASNKAESAKVETNKTDDKKNSFNKSKEKSMS